jgi:hypothetical protein
MMTTSLWSLLKEYKVVIPILQRDYAQGRMRGKVPLIRTNILNSICNAIKQKKPLELDFIYGYTNSSTTDQKVFNPLDGQQRLTTLFLFHWFIAAKEGHLDKATIHELEKFTYETRHSSRVFCSKLVNYKPEDSETSIKQSIINQPWFFTAWKNDPTIKSMLTMLDAIQEKVKEFELDHIWEYLVSENAPIVFHLLPMDKLGLPDDLYIKMNSRGKELTEFEYFKIRFSEIIPSSKLETFNIKIDQQWSDLFWDLYKDEMVPDIAQKVDAAFLRFFRYITDIIIAKTNTIFQDGIDELELAQKIYSNEEHVDFLFTILDKFVEINKNRQDFFASIFYVDPSEYEITKTRLFFMNANTELFKKCSSSYDPTQRTNPFSIGEQLMLYACIVHLQNNTVDFHVRIRKLRNLISNSEDTVRKENMSSLLQSVFDIIVNDTVDDDSRFNKTQIKQEEEKALFIQQLPQLLDTIYRLEDHHLLEGCLAIFDLSPDINDYASQFHKVFTVGCDYDVISSAMFTFGDYSQKTNWSRRLGNKNNSVWRELFTPSQRRGDFQNTQKVLYQLLEKLNQTSATLESIIHDYVTAYSLKEKDWRYYFILYPEFRNHEDGYYYWPDETKRYESVMMRRKTLGGFHWDPFIVAIKSAVGNAVGLENYGAPLIYVKGNATVKILNQNDRLIFEALDDEGRTLLNAAIHNGLITAESVYLIKQSPSGLDEENRIEKGIQIVKALNQLL